jgi:hypothetical protein
MEEMGLRVGKENLVHIKFINNNQNSLIICTYINVMEGLNSYVYIHINATTGMQSATASSNPTSAQHSTITRILKLKTFLQRIAFKIIYVAARLKHLSEARKRKSWMR